MFWSRTSSTPDLGRIYISAMDRDLSVLSGIPVLIIFRVVLLYLSIWTFYVDCTVTNLDKRYIVYFRPLFEYACEIQIWDNRGIRNSQKLKQLQMEAVRIVTVLPMFTNNEILYIETGWELLSVRQKRRKLQLFYNIVNKNIISLIIFVHWFPPLCKVDQCIHWEMGIIFYLSVDCLQAEILLSPLQYKCGIV